MELIIFENKPKLRLSQKKLLDYILVKYKDKSQVILSDIVSLYNKYSRKSDTYSEIEWFTTDDGKRDYKYVHVEYSQEQIEKYAQMWFMRNLGLLINRGYLRVIPNINFNQLQQP